MAPLETTGMVRAFDVNGNNMVDVEVQAGDIVQYKRNGSRGTLKCRILGIAPGTLRPLRLQPLGRDDVDFGRAIATELRVESVWRGGKRIPLPQPFVSVVKSYEMSGGWGELTVQRPGFNDVSLNHLSPGWPTVPLAVGQSVVVEARQIDGDRHITWFIRPYEAT